MQVENKRLEHDRHFSVLYKQGTKNAIVSTQTLTYTHITGSSMHFQFHCILVVCKLVNDQYVLFQWLANEWI